MTVRRRPQYLRMLGAILVSYALIIAVGDTAVANPARVVLLAYVVWASARLHRSSRLRWAAVWLGILAVLITVLASRFASDQTILAIVGGLSVIFISLAIAAIASTLLVKWMVDTSTVVGVLCIYLLFALFFASANQIGAAYISPYLNGVGTRPNPSDLLYFSVITLTTTGFGDITPASETARAITVVEALIGQLYLVSVVAGVVGGWRAADRQGR